MIDELGETVTYGSIMHQALQYIFLLEQAGVNGGTAVIVVGSPSRYDFSMGIVHRPHLA